MHFAGAAHRHRVHGLAGQGSRRAAHRVPRRPQGGTGNLGTLPLAHNNLQRTPTPDSQHVALHTVRDRHNVFHERLPRLPGSQVCPQNACSLPPLACWPSGTENNHYYPPQWKSPRLIFERVLLSGGSRAVAAFLPAPPPDPPSRHPERPEAPPPPFPRAAGGPAQVAIGQLGRVHRDGLAVAGGAGGGERDRHPRGLPGEGAGGQGYCNGLELPDDLQRWVIPGPRRLWAGTPFPFFFCLF